MHRFDRMHLSAEVAMRNLDTCDLEEKTKLAEGVALIAVLDHRKDYLAAGYSCMRDYCMGRLHMCESRALRRIQVARLALKFPEVFEYLADGRLSVATAVVLAPHLTPETATELLAAAAFQSRDEVVRLLAARSQRPTEAPSEAPTETSDEASSSSLAPERVNSLTDLCGGSKNGGTQGSHAPAHVDNSRRGRVFTSATGGHEVRLTLTDEEHEHFRRAQALLGHAVPSGDPALIYARAMKHYVSHLEKQRFGAKRGASKAETAAPRSRLVETASGSPAPGRPNAPRGRGIPKALRRQVWERDGGSCSFVSADGHRCGSTTRVEVDHITLVALGGRTEPENLRLLCRAHNQFEAERVLGADHVRAQRELAQRERARAKAAAEAKGARTRAAEAGAARENVRDAQGAAVMEDETAKAREVARRARNDDLSAALRGLGFSVSQAKWGVEMADAMPEASLEKCLRHALTELTRSLALRGERRARCTA